MQAEHLELARGDRLEPAGACAAARARELLDQPLGDRGSDQGVSLGDDPDRLDQPLRSDVLEEEPLTSGPQRLVDVLVEVERGEHEHRDGPVFCLCVGQHAPGRLEAVHARHLDVHEHDVGARGGEPGRRRRGRRAPRPRPSAGLRLEDRPKARAHQCLVVGDENGDRLIRHGLTVEAGGVARVIPGDEGRLPRRGTAGAMRGNTMGA